MNLDELNALVATMFTDFDRAQALQGLVFGCNGGTMPEDTSEGTSKSLRAGFEVGSKWRHEADNYLEKQRDGGRKSAENRAKTYGTAQPSPKLLRQIPEVTSTNSRTNPQSTILKESTTCDARETPLLEVEEPEQPSLPPVKRKPRKAPSKPQDQPKEPGIPEILASDGTPAGDLLADRYWYAAKCFSGKNYKAKEAAIIWRDLYRSGHDMYRVAKGAHLYHNSMCEEETKSGKDERQFMISFITWLQQEGWEPIIREHEERNAS